MRKKEHDSEAEVQGRRQEAGGRRQEAGGRSQEPGARSQEPGARSQEMPLMCPSSFSVIFVFVLGAGWAAVIEPASQPASRNADLRRPREKHFARRRHCSEGPAAFRHLGVEFLLDRDQIH